MVQVTIAAAVVAGSSLYMMKNQDINSTIQGKMNLDQDIMSVTEQMQSALGRSANCTSNLGGKLVGSSVDEIWAETLPDVGPYGELDYFSKNNPSGAKILFKKNVSIAGGQTKISDMQLVNRKNPETDEVETVFRVSFLSEHNKNRVGSFNKDFILKGDKNPDGSFKFCYSVPEEYKAPVPGDEKDIVQLTVDRFCDRFNLDDKDLAKSFYCDLTGIPEKPIAAFEKCSDDKGVFVDNGVVFAEQRISNKIVCTSRFQKMSMLKGCFGKKAFTRSCECFTAGCRCVPDRPTCYNRTGTSCEDVSPTRPVKLSKCFRKPMPLDRNWQPPQDPVATVPSAGGNGGGGGCFVAGTRISMWSGELKNIEDIKSGDIVLDGKKNKGVVKGLMKINYKGLIFSINGGGYFFTPNHPFLTVEGWKSLDPAVSMKEIPEIKVGLLKVGDILVKKEGLEVIYSLDSISSEEPVYNFEVSGRNEYIADDYVVHNVRMEFKAH